MQDEQAIQAQTKTRVTKRLKELDAQEDRYLDLLGDPDWPQDKLKAKLAAVRTERTDLAGQLANATNSLDISSQVIADALKLLTNPYELYRQLPRPRTPSDDPLTIFGTLHVDTKEIVSHQLNPPFAELLDVQHRQPTPTRPRRSYQRRTGQLDATWQATFTELERDIKQDTLSEDALDCSVVTPADLLALALAGARVRIRPKWWS